MDALITTIIAGAVVAVIGAFAAYYFGGRRARQEQVHEARRNPITVSVQKIPTTDSTPDD